MPNLPDRLAYSIAKEANAEPIEVRPEAAPVKRGPCRGGCGAEVGEGMKCVDCATRAVVEWTRARRGDHTAPV